MSDDRREPGTEPELEHDEYHSSLEIDDSSGWRALVVPIVLILLVIGALLFIFLYQGDMEPDPRIANRLKANEQQEQTIDQPGTEAIEWGNATGEVPDINQLELEPPETQVTTRPLETN